MVGFHIFIIFQISLVGRCVQLLKDLGIQWLLWKGKIQFMEWGEWKQGIFLMGFWGCDFAWETIIGIFVSWILTAWEFKACKWTDLSSRLSRYKAQHLELNSMELNPVNLSKLLVTILHLCMSLDVAYSFSSCCVIKIYTLSISSKCIWSVFLYDYLGWQ